MEQPVALIMNNMLSGAQLLACFFGAMKTDNSESHQSVTIRKLIFLSQGFHHRANCLWHIKVRVSSIPLRMIISILKGFDYTFHAEAN